MLGKSACIRSHPGLPSRTSTQPGSRSAPCTDHQACRTSVRVQADPEFKGFGSRKEVRKEKKPKTVSVAESEEEAVQRAMKFAEANRANPIRKNEAAAGRIDYAKVKNWGSGKVQDLEKLQLQSFVSGKQAGKDVGFYAQLTFAVVQAQEQGLIDDYIYNQAPVRSRQGLPDFSQWSLSKQRYVQYLVDQQAVHHTLESGIAEAIAVDQESPSVAAALDCFSESRGLDRSLEIAADLTNIDSSSSSEVTSHPQPSESAAAYVDLLGGIGRECVEGADAGDRNNASLRLVAHAYSNQLQHLTNGNRIGASAAERLNLFQKHAVNFYRTYPFQKIGKDPWKAFLKNVNEAGESLSDDEKQVVIMELPCAIGSAMQLLEALAYVD